MPYPGGKSGAGIYQRIISLMPPHSVYIEPFLGGGSVMRYKLPAEELNIGIDMDEKVIQEWRWRSLAIQSGDPAAPRSATLPAATPNPTLAADARVPGVATRSGVRRAPLVSPALASAATSAVSGQPRFWFHQGDGIAFLEGYPFTGRELVYCDPPYVRSTCTSRCRYRFDLSDVDHRRLLRRIRTLPCPVLISGYHSELYADELVGWQLVKFKAMTRRGPRTESLWFNFPAPSQLHDDRYLGTDRRQREYLKRQKQRWAERLRKMPALKRQALLSAIGSAVESEGEVLD